MTKRKRQSRPAGVARDACCDENARHVALRAVAKAANALADSLDASTQEALS